ncbi:type II restriction endonuclease [Planctomycetota bacterium]
MKYNKIFKDRIDCENPKDVFEYLINTLKNTITGWDYFINWAKVFGNIKDIEIDLNTLNYLIGKEEIEEELALLLEKHPSIMRLIPILIACRQGHFEILLGFDNNNFKYERYNFGAIKDLKIPKVVQFAKSCGFLDLLKNKRIKSVVDYVIGVEVGLDSNGRKNRGGKSMEVIVEFFIEELCKRNNLDYIKEATSKKIREEWGLTLQVDKSSRRIDFAIKKNKQIYLIETNFYGGGGSKLKSTAGEYKSMFDFWKKDGHEFIWITDGIGWKTTRLPLEETFEHTDYILNLEMIAKGLLEDIIMKEA